jgi:glycosyltransferase involved in cell wall biosynthesis
VPLNQVSNAFVNPRPWDLEEYPITMMVFGAGTDLRLAYSNAGLAPKPSVYRIAEWSWETSAFPADAVRQLDFVDEIWTPSRFVAEAARKVVQSKKVLVMPHIVPKPQPLDRAKAQFGFEDNEFIVLFIFDAGSVALRKNPMALVQAFRLAFNGETQARLVLKVGNSVSEPGLISELQTALRGLRHTILTDRMPRRTVDTLIDACDCYVSLHRSEGFGLTLAEAMLLGKPVVATDYSANTDFLHEGNGYPVKYRLVTLSKDVGPYPAGSVWAEPDVQNAAEQLRRVFEFPDEAKQKGKRAQTELLESLSAKTVGGSIATRVREILG